MKCPLQRNTAQRLTERYSPEGGFFIIKSENGENNFAWLYKVLKKAFSCDKVNVILIC